ncbi:MULTISPECIES: phosphoribosylglycinamide formyltransferase [unclassified Oceanobacillus]|uniref:phosphoribosylglycinamide formyltransferase n=1 Tax=unclassified Oceanobacillus TaxID=2630292 RepID=UPI001BEC2A37|nr:MULTISPECIES: phosphoribosylglycinamide formyltransferase [unclassified Oceanobacillus]MBT2600560.1 phosphoribosylglycinamide formyltransferase [Oceanobacillus sp. ISL-74]MBT2651043.1 phosphoribosylglycinamide formyltransferase [Oceanobacillus sp. ISL-73]
MTIKAAVFASGTGSNFEAIMEATDLKCKITLLVCDKPGALVIDKAASYDIPTLVFNPKEYSSKSEYEKMIHRQLQHQGISWIFLAGYMRLIGNTLLDEYESKILNIHPSLLPFFPGKDAIGQAYDAGARETGVSIHFVDAGMDTGPVIAQESVMIEENDTIEKLKERIQKVEHHLYPKVINQVVSNKVRE